MTKTNEIKEYNFETLKKIIDPHTEVVVMAPWYGAMIPVTIRMLDSVELAFCGDFNSVQHLIAKDTDPEVLKADQLRQIVEVKNIQEKMAQLALVRPSFKELEEHLMSLDSYKVRNENMKETEALIKQLPVGERKKYQDRLDILELSLAFILPEDFMTYIATVLLQKEATDLNRLTRDTLLRVGLLGEKYNVRPSDYIDGVFTDKQKVDIDETAAYLVWQHKQDKKAAGGVKWIRGKAKRKKRT